ncbi:TetR/AcrR family transcriptional regulator [Umezawaea beigongshangensis]|uniref:TetR/AcrR family transcriptional regulator n=1 Tax=Umezawaea beigongshangensis TaxID=2780383 RepID=UPI0018F1A4AC|nr:TetR/AcrR family transcriptional regulator [Umezawaea beigongshangensis]
MSVREKILDVAADLLARSPNADISTRAVCEAAGVGAPVLYRQFGDKEGLLAAVVDRGFDRYLATKRDRAGSTDPVEDLRAGWDTHVAFAVANPNLYRLMHSPAMRAVPASAAEAHRILTADLERAAAAGRLRISPDAAAQMIMSATVGIGLMLVTRPETYVDPGLSHRVRDAIHARVLVPDVPEPPAGAGSVASSAARLAALLGRDPAPSLTAAEAALLREWLTRLSDAPTAG